MQDFVQVIDDSDADVDAEGDAAEARFQQRMQHATSSTQVFGGDENDDGLDMRSASGDL